MAEEKGVPANNNPFGEVLIEIDTGRNDAVLFGPTQDRLRGKWDPHNVQLGDTSAVGLHTMPVIPGLHVRLNVRERRASIYDPLALPEAAEQLQAISAKHKQIFQVHCTAVPAVNREDMTQDEIATWLYWIMRAVQSGHAKRVEGVVPKSEYDIIRAFGKGVKIKKDFYNSHRQTAEAAEDADRDRERGVR